MMMKLRSWTIFALGVNAAACTTVTDDEAAANSYSPTTAMNASAVPVTGAHPTAGAMPLALTSTPASVTDFRYRGGPLMTGATNIYYVWYGAWSSNSAPSILGDFAANLGGSTYWAINTQYGDASGNRPSNALSFAGTTTDSYSQGTSISDSKVQSVVSSAIARGALPRDPNGIYFVLTSSDVTMPGFCSSMCGYHSHYSNNSVDLKYSFVGNPDQCPNSCELLNKAGSPSANSGADAMVSVVAHELEETVTDPHGDGWIGANNVENGDACAWTFGDTYPAGGGEANIRLGSRDYLVQRDLIPVGTPSCSLELRGSHLAASTGQTLRGDFDGDGKGDILWRNARTGDVSVWLMNADGTPRATAVTWSGVAPEWQIDGAADFDGDHKTDILWRNVQTGMVSTWTMDGANPVAFNVVYDSVSSDWQIAGTGDFNADGKADILWRNAVTGDVSIWPMSGTTPTAFLTIWQGVDLAWQIAGTGDFDGDGVADIVWRNTDTGQISTWQMHNFQPAFTVPGSVSGNLDLAAIGDLNGDGKADLVWHDGTNGNVSTWLMNGGAIASSQTIFNSVGREWRIYGASDVNGDGTADLVWRDAHNGDVSMWLMHNAAPTAFVLSYAGVSLDWQIMAD